MRACVQRRAVLPYVPKAFIPSHLCTVLQQVGSAWEDASLGYHSALHLQDVVGENCPEVRSFYPNSEYQYNCMFNARGRINTAGAQE